MSTSNQCETLVELAVTEPHKRRRHLKVKKKFRVGYHTMGAGKFVHGGNEKQYFDEHGGGMGGFGPLPEEKLNHKEGHKLWDWGAYPEDEKEMPDHKVVPTI